MVKFLVPCLSLAAVVIAYGVFYMYYSKTNCETPYKSIYEINVKDIDGNLTSLSAYQGKVLLIVNTASKCGLTDRYLDDLTSLYQNYRYRDFEILAFPCNQFLWQEPKSNLEIKDFMCRIRCDYPVFEKTDVNGSDAADLFKYLRYHSKLQGSNIGYNFGKFLVDKQGNIYDYYGPFNYIPSMIQDIEKLLAQ